MRLALCLVVVAACVKVEVPAELPCSIGGACPPGQVCDGLDLVCRIPGGECGDGIRNVGERCDDGNRAAGDGCHPECGGIEQCGDALVDPAEACDDGNPVEGDGCDSNCSTTACGNGVTSTGETCDDGNLASGDGCRADCLKIELCSDGLVDLALGELCDDGNVVGADGCRADCKGTEVCGDGLLDVDEACEGGASCAVTCTFATCGNGNAAAGELCMPALKEHVISDDPVGAYEVVIGDIHGDGFSDMLWLDVGALGGKKWRVRRGTADGRFEIETRFSTSINSNPQLVDIDKDGDLDLVGLNQNPRLVYELNNGTGEFGADVELSSLNLTDYAIGDFDGDGDNDVAASADFTMVILRNTGSLVFVSEPITALQPSARILAIGDVDGDQDLDLLTSEEDATSPVALRRNNGSASFSAPDFVGLSGGAFSRLAALVDLDGDTDLDILTLADNRFGVALNAGVATGSFGTEAVFAIGVDRQFVAGAFAVGDLDDDADLDVVLATGSDLAVFRNDGDGGLGVRENYAAVRPEKVRVGDVDGDGDVDIATTSASLSGSLVLVDEGVIGAARTFDVLRGQHHDAVALGHFDGDAELDVVFTNRETTDLSLLFGDGAGRFPTSKVASLPGSTEPLALAAGKLDDNQTLDLVTVTLQNATGGRAIVFANNGTGTLTSSAPIDLGLTTQIEFFRPASVALGDLDEDGELDMVAAIPGAERFAVLRGNGNGTFGSPTTIEIDPGASVMTVNVAIGYLDGDDHLDVAISNDHPSNPTVLTMRGDGTGALQPFGRELLTIDSNAPGLITALALADLDGDGDLDIFTACQGAVPGVIDDATITVFVNDGTGATPTRAVFDAGGEEPTAIAIGDIDNDGDVDVAVGTRRLLHMSIVRNDGGRALPPLRVASSGGNGPVPNGPSLADFNNDGAMDLVWASGTRLHVLLARP